MKTLLSMLCMVLAFQAHAVDLREYFPDSYTVTMNKQDGTTNARFTFTKSPSGYLPIYQQLFNQNKPGYHYLWKKDYLIGGVWTNVTNAVLFMGDDKSITETGDWYSTPSGYVATGYKRDSGSNFGLVWSPVGGLTPNPAIAEMNVWGQNYPGAAYADMGMDAFSKVGLIEVLPTYTPPFGRDSSGVWRAGGSKEYTDVVRIVMYHGTKSANSAQIRCPNAPVSADGPYYQSFKTYNSYAMEIYLAKGKGIIQMDVPFIEDAAYWNRPNCIGSVFDSPYAWATYIDEP